MVTAISKLIPVVTLAGGAAASSPKIQAQIAKVVATTQVIATQHEVSEISKLVYLDSIDGQHPKPEQFADYLRKNMRMRDGIARDTSKDQWGQPYRLVYNKQRRQLIVSSAGPDTRYDTSDDIQGSYPMDYVP